MKKILIVKSKHENLKLKLTQIAKLAVIKLHRKYLFKLKICS